MNERDRIGLVRRSLRERAEALPVSALRWPRLDRRTFLLGTTAAGLAWTRSVGGHQASPEASPVATPALAADPFSLGIASGEPLPDGVVLWTRLAPDPFAPDGGMGASPVEVAWEVASDEAMTRIVQQGTAIADPAWAHSVHVEITGLEPARWYWYRFRVGDAESEIGRTKTAPAAGTTPERLRFAFASCQRWDQGLYTAYRDMAAQDVDLVIHLGDYIYEMRMSARTPLREGDFPFSALVEAHSLENYRARYALHKVDPHLREMHRLAPWIVTWDDHEVHNNFFGGILRDDPASATLLERRAAAYQAYYEHMPLRETSRPKGPDLQLFRRLAFGDLLEVNVLDTRQYRSPQGQLCDDATRAANGGFCPASLDPSRTLLGEAQKGWLLDGFDRTSARWNLLAQQIPMARIDNDASPEGQSFGGREMDKWDGYAAERDEVVAALASAARARSFSPVVITGDVHANYVWDLKTDWDDTSDASVFGTEFVGTSISSEGDSALEEDGGFTTLCGNRNGNPHNHLFDNHRGYVLCDVAPEQWDATYRVLPTVKDPEATASTLTRFVVEHGRPGAQQDGCPSSQD
jgi:alkaline phosphatase D